MHIDNFEITNGFGLFWLMCLTVQKLLIGRDWRIRWLHLCWGVKPTPEECSVYDTTPSDDGALVQENVEYHITAITPWSTLIQRGNTC